MLDIDVHDAEIHLSQLVTQAPAGEEIIISQFGKPIARLVAFKQGAVIRKKGLLRGKIKMNKDLVQSLPVDQIDLFEGKAQAQETCMAPILLSGAGLTVPTHLLTHDQQLAAYGDSVLII